MKAYYRELHKYKYQLTKDYVHQTNFIAVVNITTEYLCLDDKGRLLIKKGYCWDGPSGPTIDTKSAMRGSLVHDALYQLMRMGLLLLSNRKGADKELYQTCLEDNMWKWRAWLWYRAVKKAAGWAVEPNTQKDKIFCVGKKYEPST